MISDRAKMNLAGHRVWRLSGNYFEPWKCFGVNFHRKHKHKEQGSSDQAANKQAEATDQPTNYVKPFREACLGLLTCKFLRDNAFILHNFQSGFRRDFSTETALIQLMDQILFDLNIDKVLVLSLLITKRHLMSSTITSYSQSLSW